MIKNKNFGFSLIEVAIAIIIIGLIASFAMKGKELIHSTKLNSIGEQINSFRVATQMFVDKYGAIPGDLANAKDMIDDSIENGRGIGEIVSVEDAKRFWKHLTASGLLNVELINGYPISKLGGYYSASSDIPGNDGIWIILSLGTTNNVNFKGAVSQEEAYQIDKKNDNGNPSSGEIRTFKSTPTGLIPIGQKYNVKDKNKDCVIMFRIW